MVCFSNDMMCVCVFLQKSIQGEERYGPSLSDVEKQIAAHNILHKEIEAYRSALRSSDVSLHTHLKTHTHIYMNLYLLTHLCIITAKINKFIITRFFSQQENSSALQKQYDSLLVMSDMSSHLLK